MIVKDLFTNFIILRICDSQINGKVVAKLLHDIFSDFGVPKCLHTDSGTEFCNSSVAKLLEKYKIIHQIGTPHHQNSNSVETAVKEVQRVLAKVVDDKENWREFIYQWYKLS